MNMLQYKTENITVFQSALYKTTSAIIESDHAMVMTDPCWLPEEVETIRNYVNQNKGNRELFIVYTHSDFDHIIGAGAFPEAKVIASEAFQSNPHKKEILNQIDEFDQKYYLERSYVHEYPSVDIVVTKEGQTLELEDITLTFYSSPGHTNDGVFTVVEPMGIFLSGVYLSDVEFPFIFDSYQSYQKTLERAAYILKQHNISIHVPGHGSTTDKHEEMMDRLHFSQYYVHNLLNEDVDLEQELYQKYSFFEGMKSIHESNKALASQELKK